MSTSNHPADLPVPDMGCQTAAELMPWLFNGSLEEGERRALLDHVAACQSCRAELDETFQVWQMVDEHAPSLDLARYADGRTDGGLDIALLERHLALCPSCRQEVEWASADRVVDLDAERARRRPSRRRESGGAVSPVRWRRWAMAAGIAAAVVWGGFFWTSQFEVSTAEYEKTQSHDRRTDQDPAGGERGDSTFLLFEDSFESGDLVSWSTTS